MNEAANRNLTCESCKKEFSCDANTGKCWCFEIQIPNESLANLRDNFENCLCEECLDKLRVKNLK